MTNAQEIRQSLHGSVIEAYSNEYKELADTWRNLETKAQSAITIAGIFIAGAFAYVRDIRPETHKSEKVLLGVCVCFLIASVVLSILALRLRKIAAPLMGENLDKLVDDLLQISEDKEFLDRLPNYYNDQIALWQQVKKETHDANQSKARFLWWAHITLVLAIVVVACITVLKTIW
jgi:hypothetical protein